MIRSPTHTARPIITVARRAGDAGLLGLIVIGHKTILLPAPPAEERANGASPLGGLDLGVAHDELSREPFADVGVRASPECVGVHRKALQFAKMNPDKLFDYLDGRLLPTSACLEERLMSDKQLQRELAVARQIHAGMHGDSREVVLPPPEDVPEQGRKMAIRIGVAFMVLMFVNVGIGL